MWKIDSDPAAAGRGGGLTGDVLSTRPHPPPTGPLEGLRILELILLLPVVTQAQTGMFFTQRPPAHRPQWSVLSTRSTAAAARKSALITLHVWDPNSLSTQMMQ